MDRETNALRSVIGKRCGKRTPQFPPRLGGSSKTQKNTNTMIADTPELINGFRLLSLKGALKLEALGMKHSRGSVAPFVRSTIGSKTKDKTVLLAEFETYLRNAGILR
jgi:hypothetical protein